jgi:uncharacterized integral membrane protein (TIGR00697 family)
MHTIDNRANRLFIVLAGFFLTNALIAEFVGVKIFSFEDTVGAPPFTWSLFGIHGTLNFTAGVLLWPFVFIMTDVINEYFGVRGVRLISWIAVVFIAYAFLAAYAAISLAPAAFWVDVNKDLGVPDIQKSYALVFGQGLWTIGGSIVAFLVGQLIDVAIFHKILKITGDWGKFKGDKDAKSTLKVKEPKVPFEIDAAKKSVVKPKAEKKVEAPAEEAPAAAEADAAPAADAE